MNSGQKPDPIVICTNVCKRYGAFVALNDVNLEVSKGEVFCIVGPSGGGKSTFLRTINGLESIDSGTIRFDGITIPGPARNVDLIRREAGMWFKSLNWSP